MSDASDGAGGREFERYTNDFLENIANIGIQAFRCARIKGEECHVMSLGQLAQNMIATDFATGVEWDDSAGFYPEDLHHQHSNSAILFLRADTSDILHVQWKTCDNRNTIEFVAAVISDAPCALRQRPRWDYVRAQTEEQLLVPSRAAVGAYSKLRKCQDSTKNVSYHIRNVPVSATIEMSRCGFHQAVEKIGVFIC